MKFTRHLLPLAALFLAGQLASACNSTSPQQAVLQQTANRLVTQPNAQQLAPGHWSSNYYADHPLVGTVWRGNGQVSSWNALTDALLDTEYILIGEIHPNRDHHAMQSRVIELLAQRDRKPLVVWEMIPEDKQAVLDAQNLTTAEAVRALEKKLNWSSSGWPPWSIYEPIALAAARHNLSMRGAALDSTFLREMAANGVTNLPADHLTRLHLKEPLSEISNASMLDQLYSGHCELMPKTALAPMQLVQRARDGAMADAMLRQAEHKHGAVLIAGNGHVRKDWGVAAVLERHLEKHSIDANVLSIAQIEVTDAASAAADYTEINTEPEIYDFILFTPRADVKDHCAELRKRFEG
jgi:uncharacterized iron-regulated protein